MAMWKSPPQTTAMSPRCDKTTPGSPGNYFFDASEIRRENHQNKRYEPGSKLLVLGINSSHLYRESGNPYNGYINPYYWVEFPIPYYMEIMGVDRPDRTYASQSNQWTNESTYKFSFKSSLKPTQTKRQNGRSCCSSNESTSFPRVCKKKNFTETKKSVEPSQPTPPC